MANPSDVLNKINAKYTTSKKIQMEDVEEAPNGGATIKEFIAKVFTTRNLVHFSHWATASYATHIATGDFYDDIVEIVDDLVEVYMGKYGKITDAYTNSATTPADIVAHVKEEAKWLAENRESIANECCAVENILDTLEAAYLKTIYKLENLH